MQYDRREDDNNYDVDEPTPPKKDEMQAFGLQFSPKPLESIFDSRLDGLSE